MKKPARAGQAPTALAALLEQDFAEWPELTSAGAGAGDQGAEAWRAGSVVPTELWERALLAPARDFLLRPGKEIRARLVENAWVLAGGDPPSLPPELPLLVEILHAGSLIVDDVEDDSRQRRGADALHHTYGTSIAINTGNWLYYWPFVLLGRIGLPPATQLELYRRASVTMLRCHQGQALDLSARVFELGAREIPGVVATTTRLKTGSLMELAATLGAVAAGATADHIDVIGRFGRELGTGLQMLDDLGGLVAPARRDKGHEDLRLSRPTWPWAWLADGAHGAHEMAFAKLHGDARAVFQGADPETVAGPLRDAVAATGQAHIRRHLASALAELGRAFPESPTLAVMRGDVEHLQNAYA